MKKYAFIYGIKFVALKYFFTLRNGCEIWNLLVVFGICLVDSDISIDSYCSISWIQMLGDGAESQALKMGGNAMMEKNNN